MTDLITVGSNGYGVRLTDSEAIVIHSVSSGVSVSARYPYSEGGRFHAVTQATWTALTLSETEDNIRGALTIMERDQ